MKVTLASYLASIPDDGAAKADGIKLGEAVAAKVLEARANDGRDAADDYRPRTTPGVYVPTPITAASTLVESEAVRRDDGIPIPARSADFAVEQGMGN
jgi:hypothetical protein